LPTPGLTAWQALFDKADLKSGQKLLVHAAACGVGSFAVQFAKWKGARCDHARPDELAQIARLVAAGEIKVHIETILPLSKARRAQELSQTGHATHPIALEKTNC